MTAQTAYAETTGASPIAEWCRQTEDNLAAIGVGNETWYSLPRSEQYRRLELLVGNTHLLAVPEIPGVYAKQEFTNPSGSHYDRASLPTLQLLETGGYIQPGDELRDITSGSGGISLALFAKLLGYKARISLPDELPASRVYPMEYFGAEIVRTGPGYIQATSDSQAAEIMSLVRSGEWVLKRTEDRGIKSLFFTHRSTGQRVCYVNHSENVVSVSGHQRLGQEIVAQAPEIPRAVVLAIGNWTTIAGVAPVIREAWPATEIVGVKPSDDSDQTDFGLVAQGLNIKFRFKDESLLDRVVIISDAEREVMRERINNGRDTNRQLGNSSLLCLAAAQTIQAAAGGNVITINYDQAMRY